MPDYTVYCMVCRVKLGRGCTNVCNDPECIELWGVHERVERERAAKERIERRAAFKKFLQLRGLL